jgi:hypothetical protein
LQCEGRKERDSKNHVAIDDLRLILRVLYNTFGHATQEK